MFISGDPLIILALIISKLLYLYMWIIIIQALLSWVRPDPYNPIVRIINRLVYPVTYRISRIVPTRIGMVDISPIILLALVWFVREALYRVIVSREALLP